VICCVACCSVLLCCFEISDALECCVVSCCIVLCCVVLCCVVLCCVVLCCDMLRCVMLRWVVLCFVLCCVLLRCVFSAVLCCVMLCVRCFIFCVGVVLCETQRNTIQRKVTHIKRHNAISMFEHKIKHNTTELNANQPNAASMKLVVHSFCCW